MARWFPCSEEIARSPRIARLGSAGRQVYFAFRLAHSMHGSAGVVPGDYADAVGLQLLAPAWLGGVDVDAGIAELEAAGLIAASGEGVALTDFDPEIELPLCKGCKGRNPTPRQKRCPKCASRPPRRARVGGAGTAQTVRGDDTEGAQTSHGADTAPTDPTPPHPTDSTESDPTRASGGGCAASQPAGEGIGEGQSLYAFLLGTNIRSKSRNRQQVIRELATDLEVKGMHVDQARRLQAAARNVPGVEDADALLASWLTSDRWQEVWSEHLNAKVNGVVHKLSRKLGRRVRA
jgi:hypothetical protein